MLEPLARTKEQPHKGILIAEDLNEIFWYFRAPSQNKRTTPKRNYVGRAALTPS